MSVENEISEEQIAKVLSLVPNYPHIDGLVKASNLSQDTVHKALHILERRKQVHARDLISYGDLVSKEESKSK